MSTNVHKSRTLKHTQKYEPETEPEPNSMSDIVKFQSLKLNQTYQVQNYTELAKGEYPYRILEVSEDGSEEIFKVFATPLLLKYIEQENPGKLDRKSVV